MDAPFEFIVVAEAKPDACQATQLADRVFVEDGPRWLENRLLDANRTWTGFEDNDAVFSKWAGLKQRVFEQYRMPRYLGHTHSGKPGAADSAGARKVVLLAQKLAREGRPICAVLLIRDMDRQQERRQGLEQGREEANTELKVVIGAVNPKREAWVLNGFEPEDEGEREKLRETRENLGFWPHEEAQELYASSDDALRSAKRVLRELTNGSKQREKKCWQQTDLVLLRQRGGETGLQEYLEEIKSRLLPLLT